MSFIQVARRRFAIAGELVSFLWSNKRWWMLPLIIVLLLTGVLIILAESSPLGPFIYALI